MKSIKKILGYIRKADNEYNLIEPNDHVVVGISGGKDSLTLLYCLGLYQRYSEKEYKLTGMFIDVGFDQNGFDEVCEFFKPMGIEVIRVQTHIKEILEMHLHNGEYNCYTCSKLKKGALIKEAKKIGATKIALGHHLDDAIETLFLNEIYSGKIETIKFKRYFDRENITTIRPMLYIHEDEIIKASKEICVPVMKSNCPRDGVSKRADIKDLLNQIYEKYPEAKINFANMIDKPELVSIWEKEKSANN